MSSIGAVCDSLGKTFLSLLVDNLGATGGFRLNSFPVKVKLIIFTLFLPEGNTILQITPKAVCVGRSGVRGELKVTYSLVHWLIDSLLKGEQGSKSILDPCVYLENTSHF